MTSPLFLKVQRIEQTCLFELAWDQGRQIRVQIPYPETLTSLYRTWQDAYLHFHQTGQRARPGATGTGVMPEIDWRAKLVQAEAALLSEFHYWLSHADLLELRSTLARFMATAPLEGLEIFLDCAPIEVIRLPWEAWEIGAEFGHSKPLRFVRMPSQIRSVPGGTGSSRRRVRILAILGDDTGLDFATEKATLQSLSLAEVEFVGWQDKVLKTILKEQICHAIADPIGWDILFFAGHSNETNLTGGELGIAPNQSMLMQELVPYLQTAKERGLKFAVFNSCKGISIAQTLIDLGLNEVAVMREPISNAVAQEFFVQFVQSLAQLNDVHTAVRNACHYLKLEKSVTYPSAHLVPSVFRHPQSQSFKLSYQPWQKRLQQWLPTKREGIALAACLFLSVLPSVQSFLLEQRLWLQAVYREQTGQLPPAHSPVTLLQIDEESLHQAGIDQPQPMNRQYLAQIVEHLAQHRAKVVALDYFLDRPQLDHDALLAKAVRESIARNSTWFIFGAYVDNGKQVGVLPSTQIASRDWSLQGYTNAPQWYVTLPQDGNRCTQCPFAYLLAIAHQLRQEPSAPHPQLQASSQGEDFWSSVTESMDTLSETNRSMQFLKSLRQQPLTQFSQVFDQRWLQPILDFSIPPDRVFRSIPAWRLLDPQKGKEIGDLSQTIVMIIPGGYGEAGIDLATRNYKDTFDAPSAIAHWRTTPNILMGGEALAYMVHQLLTQRLVIPIPDLWLVILVAIGARGLQLMTWRHKRWLWMGGLFVYSAISLQVFISAAIVLPIVLPGLVLVLYDLPWVRRRSNV